MNPSRKNVYRGMAIPAVLLGSIFFSASLLAQESLPWPQFRGPYGNGHAPDTRDVPVHLNLPKSLVWQQEIPGSGWSSPVLDEQRIWVTTAVPTSRVAAEVEPTEGLELVLVALDRRTGVEVLNVPLFHLAQPELIHSLNSYASPTPCLDQSHVYCHFGTFGTAAVRRSDGQIIWKNQEIRLQHSTGPGSSPILHAGKLIFHADGMDTQSIVALDCGTGQIAWQTPRSGAMSNAPDQKKAFCTPQLAHLQGQTLLLSPAANWLYVYNPDDGTELFKVPYGELGYSTVPRPVVDSERGLAYLCTGFDRSRLLCVDIRPDADCTPEQRVRWAIDQRIPTMPSPLLVQDWLFVISDAGIATCVDARSGDVLGTERLRGKFASSPLLADGKLYVGNQAGEILILRPGPEFEILATAELDAAIMASPIAVHDQLYIRTAKSLYLFADR